MKLLAGHMRNSLSNCKKIAHDIKIKFIGCLGSVHIWAKIAFAGGTF